MNVSSKYWYKKLKLLMKVELALIIILILPLTISFFLKNKILLFYVLLLFSTATLTIITQYDWFVIHNSVKI